mgnify:FL=1
MEKNDKQLVWDYLSGDETALNIIIRRHLKLVYNFAYRLTGRAQDSEDISQETFIKIWKNIKRYDQNQEFKTWLLAIAKNTAIDWLRKRKDFVFSDFETTEGKNSILDFLADSAPIPDKVALQAEDKKFIGELLSQLSPSDREIISFRYDDSLTFEKIGRILSQPLNTVKSRHRRAMVFLRKILNRTTRVLPFSKAEYH